MKLTLWMALPLILVFALLFVCNPQKSYVNHAGKIQKTLLVWLEDIQDLTTSVMTGTPISGSAKKVNLQTIGAKSNSTRSVMVVRSPVDGKLYLRERDYDVYTGTTWEATADRKEKFTAGLVLAWVLWYDKSVKIVCFGGHNCGTRKGFGFR